MTIQQAELFAKFAHYGQVRRYTCEPYVEHCRRVAEMVAPFDAEVATVAAWLHDTIEDTKVTGSEIEKHFGSIIRHYVDELTNVPRYVGNRAFRNKVDLERLAGASAVAQTIKCADLIDNTESIVTHDRKFARVYLPEKRVILNVLTRANSDFRRKAFGSLEAAECALLNTESER